MKKTKKLHEGRRKKLYATTEADQLILEFKDDPAAGEGTKAAAVKGRGSIDKDLSAYLFDYLEGFHIPTHLIKNLNARDLLVRRLEMIPMKVMMYNMIAGNLDERYGIDASKELNCPVMEFYLKDEKRNDPMINQSHVIAFNLATADEVHMIERLTSKINAILKSFFLRRKLLLVHFTVEFGRYKNKIVLGDEISPATCYLWDAMKTTQIGKERSRPNYNELELDYEEIKNRIFSKV
ncbi:MAG: phosphoribosylaminoimidazolesuccinocarboxamide synthase [candidate division KSB1 bacterium]|nr:phosphoribosylaminoimidazolesuccinocarboxamide synthase [candidate division KSB1 bacterium]MDZ7339914.1 phosphoribosylaminoimidazolesuccinocarboxamide synthase [candidate division KSB1 bacterium]